MNIELWILEKNTTTRIKITHFTSLSISVPFGNIKKPLVFWRFQEVWKWSIGVKWVNKSMTFCCTAQKMKFSIKDFFSKCDQICRKLRIWSHLQKKSLMENFIFLRSADSSCLFLNMKDCLYRIQRNYKLYYYMT